MTDLTVLFITANRVPESWAVYHRNILLEAVGDSQIITLSMKPTLIGLNIVQNEGRFSHESNPDYPDPHLVDAITGEYSGFYAQLLKGCRLADTPYVAVAEDDTLYPKEHFAHRPPLDTLAYNLGRWSLYTWGPPVYSYMKSMMGCAGIYPRELAVNMLEERFSTFDRNKIPFKYFGELGRYEKWLGVTVHPVELFYSQPPIIQLNHDYFSTIPNTEEYVKRRHKKRMGFLRATNIPFWGEASEIVKRFV